MEQQGIQQLVGRVMIDPDFLNQLVRAPETVLAGYRLSREERAVILQAVQRLGLAPSSQQVRGLQAHLIKRWAT